MLKLLVREAESEAVETELLQWSKLATSVVTKVELPRAIARAREERPDVVIDGSVVLQGVLASAATVPLGAGVVAKARDVSPVHVGALDAIHVASALWRGGESTRTDEDTIELISRLAAHHPDRQIAAVLDRQGRRTGTELPFTEARVKGARQRVGIAAALPPDPDSETVTIEQAAAELDVSTSTIRRWLREGLLPGEQVTPNAPELKALWPSTLRRPRDHARARVQSRWPS